MVSERNRLKLSQLANYAAWKSGGEGVRNYVVRQMNLLYATLSDEISYALGDDHNFVKANTLALRSLNDTVTFITQLMNYIDIIYDTSARQHRGVMIFGSICSVIYCCQPSYLNWLLTTCYTVIHPWGKPIRFFDQNPILFLVLYKVGFSLP